VDVDWIHLAEDRVQQAAFCEHGNEPAIEYWECLDCEWLIVPQGRLCSMEIDTHALWPLFLTDPGVLYCDALCSFRCLVTGDPPKTEIGIFTRWEPQTSDMTKRRPQLYVAKKEY
jgi:hypothetical protein